MWRKAMLLVFGLMLVTVVPVVGAQDEQCLALAEAAFSALESSCSAAGAASACYVMAAAVPGADGFAAAGDTLALADVMTVTTAPLNLEAGEWGMARLNVHANVPRSVSEEGLTYLLIGEATLENTVPASAAFTPATPITLQALVGANLRSAPTTDARVVGSAPAGGELAASGLSADGQWAYITYEDIIGWVSLQVAVPLDGDLSTLPAVSNDSRTLMQDIVLTTGTDSSACSEQSPSMLVLQAPQGVNAAVTVNGSDLRFAGTSVIRTLPGNTLQLFVMDGSASNGVVSVPPGFTVTAPLAADGRTLGGPWAGLRPMTAAERGFVSILEAIPAAALYTALAVPTQEQITATLRSVNQAAASAGPQAVSGGSGGGDCAGFRPTSPLDGLAFGPTTFYWDGVPNATQYRVNVYTDGELAHTETLDALSTTTTFDTASATIGDGLGYGWNVEAISNGQVVCTSGTVTLLRESAPQRASGGGDTDGGGSDGGGGNDCGWDGC